jgi:5-methylcytosine-specific restriction endonuclease McrA
MVLPLLDDGAISLTTVGLLSPHLTEENYAALFEGARHKSKREVERLVAAIHHQPDIPASIRALPARRPSANAAPPMAAGEPRALGDCLFGTPAGSEVVTEAPTAAAADAPARAPSHRSLVAPLTSDRSLIRMTVSEDTHQKLQRAQDLLRRVVPDGDPAAIVDRALTVLLQQLEQRKLGATERPRGPERRPDKTAAHSRVVPASVRRAVWTRDQGQCAFEGSEGRCARTGGLEFHHVVPFASGGPATVANLQLRCRAHNAFEGRQIFGDWRRPVRTKAGARRVNSVRTELIPIQTPLTDSK